MRTRFAALAACAATLSAAHAQSVFINLGANSQAEGVSSDGNYVVGQKDGTVFRWTEAGGMTMYSGGSFSRISDDGSVMSWFAGASVKRWTQATGAVTVSGLTPSSLDRLAMSGDGNTIAVHEKKWNSTTGITTLQAPSGVPAGQAWANGINYDGSVIAGSYVTGTSYPTMWNAAGAGTSLGNIPGYPVNGVAMTVSSDGQKILGFGQGLNGLDAFRWTPAAGMQALQVAPAGYTLVSPNDVTPDGNILVGTNIGHAFLWRAGYGPRYIQDILTEEFGLNLENIVLEMATGLSDDARTVVGYGSDNNTHVRFGWVVHLDHSIPAPGSGVTMIAGALLAFRRRR